MFQAVISIIDDVSCLDSFVFIRLSQSLSIRHKTVDRKIKLLTLRRPPRP